ncbi:MAG: FAD-dependent oxidoreductase [Chloroflexi bacterium]|nr:FAD-dependent oxidoreductase [Chloroflexota bacterium]
MRIGIIGGGLMGIALAYFLSQAGEQVTVLEQGAELGGLNGRIQFGGLTVARYQHAILPNDDRTRSLCARLGLESELVFRTVRTGFIHDNRIYPMTSLRDFLSFAPLTLKSRLQLGGALLQAQRRDRKTLDVVPVKDWLVQAGGAATFEGIWRPLLEAKFDGQYDTVPATYIWAWINRMMGIRRLPHLKGKVGYLRRGHYSLLQAMAEAILRRGGHIATQTRVREIIIGDGPVRALRTPAGLMQFDLVIAAIATPAFAQLVPGADRHYLERLGREKYLGLICPVMVLAQPLSEYWTLNLTDPNSPFSSITEIPHAEHPDCHVVYLPRYTASDNDWLGVPDEDIREAWLAHLKQVFRDFDEKHIRHFAVSRSRYVEPVYSIHASEKATAVQTPYPSLFLANTSQVYPELPTSEAVIVHAARVADRVRQPSPAAPLPA